MRPESWEAFQLDYAAVTLSDRIDSAAHDAARTASGQKDTAATRNVRRAVERAVEAILKPARRVRRRDVEVGRRRILDIHPDGELSWRYEDEPAPDGARPVGD